MVCASAARESEGRREGGGCRPFWERVFTAHAELSCGVGSVAVESVLSCLGRVSAVRGVCVAGALGVVLRREEGRVGCSERGESVVGECGVAYVCVGCGLCAWVRRGCPRVW